MNDPCPKCGKERALTVGDYPPEYFCHCVRNAATPAVLNIPPDDNYLLREILRVLKEIEYHVRSGR